MKKIIIIFICILDVACQMYGQKRPTIDKSRFEISASAVSFSEDGGKRSLIVTADKEWFIKSYPDSWVTVTKNGGKIHINVSKNQLPSQRSTTFSISSIGRIINVTVSQAAATTFSITPTVVKFSSYRDAETFTVISSKPWQIETQPASWGRLSRNGNMLTLTVDANTKTTLREDYFSIRSGNKTIRVDISQSGRLSKFAISSEFADFEAKGGSKTFTVTSTDSWQIETQPASWGKLSRNGNTLTLTVEANTKTTPRGDYFSIRSGNKTIRVDISQSRRPFQFAISTESAKFEAKGGSKTFTVTSTDSWEIETQPASWGRLSRNGNILTLTVDTNNKTTARTDYFTIISGNKQIRVNIKQDGLFLLVNGSSNDTFISFDNRGFSKKIYVNTNANNFEILEKPDWCYINEKNLTEINVACYANNTSYYRDGYMEVKAGENKVRINISQNPNPKKYKRRRNGGWINMALGYEGGVSVNNWGDLWYANGLVGLRIGNYADILQLEFGAAPGVVAVLDFTSSFHLPLYSSLKLSSRNGSFYVKMGGAYNIIRDERYEGEYSLRMGLGSAWKHFEWDWCYIQLNAPSDYYGDIVMFRDIFDVSNMMLGMRMAWYITR